MSSRLPMACMRSPATQTASTTGMGSYRVTIFAPVYSFNFSVQNTCHLLGINGHRGLPQRRFLRRFGKASPRKRMRAIAGLAFTEISKRNAKEFVFITQRDHTSLKIAVFRYSSMFKMPYAFCIVFFNNYSILNRPRPLTPTLRPDGGRRVRPFRGCAAMPGGSRTTSPRRMTAGRSARLVTWPPTPPRPPPYSLWP